MNKQNGIIEHPKSVIFANYLRACTYFDEIILLQKKCQEFNLDFLVFKGIPLSIDLYGDIQSRMSCDIDCLINVDQYRDFFKMLKEMGYKCCFSNDLDFDMSYIPRESQYPHVFPFYRKVKGIDVFIEVHLSITCEFRKCSYKVDFRKDIRVIEYGKAKITTLTHQLMFFHLINHYIKHLVNDFFNYYYDGNYNITSVITNNIGGGSNSATETYAYDKDQLTSFTKAGATSYFAYDKMGNPIEIATVVVWHVADTAKALFDVDHYPSYVSMQTETALRHVASIYAYDHAEDSSDSMDSITLRSNIEEVSTALKHELTQRLAPAGVAVDDARLTHLAYAPEIAQAMLRRQQAEAVIAARKKIVEGAVTMVEMAVDELGTHGKIELDDERKAQMASNLMVVLCGESEAKPIVNTGSLY